MQRSVAFYQRLGFDFEPYWDGSSYAFLSMNGLSLHLAHTPNPDFVFNAGGVYFYLDDVDSFFVKLTEAGVATLDRPKDRPWGTREFAVSDPDETLLRFGQLLSKDR